MNIKVKLILYPTILFSASLIPSISIFNAVQNNICGSQEREREREILFTNNELNNNYNEEFEVWKNTIIESSDNTNVKVFFTRNITMGYQQALIATNYMLQSKKERTGSDEIVWFVDYDLYDIQKYNFNHYNQKYGLQDSTKNISSKYNFSLWSRLGKQFSNIDTTNKDDNYRIRPSEYQIGNFLENYVKKYGDNVKFDVWVPDISLVDMWKSGIKAPTATNFYAFFKHVNKFNIITDGNWQTLNLATTMVDRLNKSSYVQMTTEEMDNNVKLFQSDVDNSYYSEFRKHDLYDYLHYSKMITVFHTKGYTNSPYYVYPENKTLYTANSIDYDYVSMSENYFANDEVKKNQYITDFETFFNIQNNKSIVDFVWKNVENYDPKKKNIIWMGDSLIRPDANGNEIYRYKEKEEEINKTIQAHVKKFPTSEYNYFVKHHPSFDREYQENLNQYLFKDIINPICINPLPWETFLSWDHKMQVNNKDGKYNPFFSEWSNSSKFPNTKLIGIQYTTTTVQTTAFYLAKTYKMNLDQIYKSIGISDWPIPMTFDIVKRTTSYSVDANKQYKINCDKIDDIYAPFYYLNVFPDYVKDRMPTLSYINKLGIDFYLKNESMNNTTIILATSIPTISIILLCFVISIFIFKKNKKCKFK
ncbi:hypothetical protein [Malacoplasma muris]|uniref:hypothetical protein n=1 Tax=Malacoplasma muris TaxID=2119 RepID=UPI00398EAA51